MRNDQFLTSAAAARVLDITPAGVRMAAIRGRLKVAQFTTNGQRLFKMADLERYSRNRANRRPRISERVA